MRIPLLCTLVAACLPATGVRDLRYRAVATTSITAAAKPDDCTFDLLRLRPDRPFEELAAVEDDHDYATSVDELRAAIAPQVCRVGGDAVIARPNADGYYPGGVIIRYTSPAS